MIHGTTRTAELRHILTSRQHEAQREVQRRTRAGRTTRPIDVGGGPERTDANSQGDIDFSLLQVKAATLARIDAALLRLDAGIYGCCCDCHDEIAERRLRALPFAVRCQACEETREQTQGLAQRMARQGVGLPLFAQLTST